MKTSDAQIERRILITALQHRHDRTRNFILSKCQPEHFGTEEGIEARTRIGALLHAGKDTGDVSIFCSDPTLSPETIEFLKCSRKTADAAAKQTERQIKKMVQILHDYRKIRLLFAGVQEITEVCSQQYSDDTLRKAETSLLEMMKALRVNNAKKVNHFGKRSEEEVRQWLLGMMKPLKRQFIPTGLMHLDKHLRGWRRGDLVVISAPRGGGKTAILLQMMINQFRAGYNVGIASLEMDEEQLMERMLASVSGTKFTNVRLREYGDGERRREIWREWKRFELETAQKHHNFFSPWELKESDYRPENLELDMGPFGYDIIYVDYLSLFGTGDKKTMWEAQKEHGRYLKQLAGRLKPKCVVVLLTQLSKDERVKYGTGPEEDADYWLWWRYGDEEKETGRVDLRLEKARHALTGIVPAKFDLAHMRITTVGGLQNGMSNYVDNQKKRKRGGRDEKRRPSTDFNNPLLDAQLDDMAVERGY